MTCVRRLRPILLLGAIVGTAAVGETAIVTGTEETADSARSARVTMTVAVLPLSVQDNSMNGDSKRLAEWLRGEGVDPTSTLRAVIVEPETYAALEEPPTVLGVESERLEEALRAQGMEARRCSKPDCATLIGRSVGADRIVTGEITKLSVLIWFVTARVIDVSTGKLLRQDEFEVKGDIVDLMPKVMGILSRRFARVA